jgi:cytochrome b561
MKTPALALEQDGTLPPHYDRGTIALHWITALLVITLFALAEIWGFLPHGTPLRRGMQSVHISLGILLAVVFAIRLVWRSSAAKRIPHATTGLQHIAATAMHFTLYGLLAAQIVLGFLFRWAEGPASFFGLVSIPSPLTISHSANGWIGFLHYYNAWLIICLAGGHAVAALLHHYVLRDQTLRRMT